MITPQTPIESWVLDELANEPDHIQDHLYDITRYGCESGAVSSLVYTQDCLHFYAKFETTIWDVLTQYLEEIGVGLGDFFTQLNLTDLTEMKVRLSWFCVEHSVYRLLNEWEVAA